MIWRVYMRLLRIGGTAEVSSQHAHLNFMCWHVHLHAQSARTLYWPVPGLISYMHMQNADGSGYSNYQRVMEDFALHQSQLNVSSFRQIWNEPDLTTYYDYSSTGTAFFHGTSADYAEMYAAAANGMLVRAACNMDRQSRATNMRTCHLSHMAYDFESGLQSGPQQSVTSVELSYAAGIWHAYWQH